MEFLGVFLAIANPDLTRRNFKDIEPAGMERLIHSPGKIAHLPDLVVDV